MTKLPSRYVFDPKETHEQVSDPKIFARFLEKKFKKKQLSRFFEKKRSSMLVMTPRSEIFSQYNKYTYIYPIYQ